MNGRRPRTKPPLTSWQNWIPSTHDGKARSSWSMTTSSNKRKVKELLRAIIEWRRRTRARMDFFTQATVTWRKSPGGFLQLMAEAGFRTVFSAHRDRDGEPEGVQETTEHPARSGGGGVDDQKPACRSWGASLLDLTTMVRTSSSGSSSSFRRRASSRNHHGGPAHSPAQDQAVLASDGGGAAP